MDNSISQQVEQVLNRMDPITLEEMDFVRLMRRRDVKYVVPSSDIARLISLVSEKYKVLEIKGSRLQDYQTLYFDTPDLEMYHEHHNRRLNRYKVRIRKYVNSNLSYFEVKYKNNKGETIKRRIRPDNPENVHEERTSRFLENNSPYSSGDLDPALRNYFKRITLVHTDIPERLTVDIELNYANVEGDRDLALPGFSVIEIKKDRDATHSDMISVLRREHYLPLGFSKYCIGTAIMKPGVKKNLFKSRLRQLGKIEESFNHLHHH